MRKTVLALNIVAAIAATNSAYAVAENSRAVLEEVVVTAQKRAESSQDVPISIQAFSAEGMEKLGASELFDLTKSAPSLSTGGIAGSNQASGMRGIVDFGRNIGIDARMGVYIDGVYQGRSYSANQPLLGLESVELLRGPQGTLFGKNTVSGAINLNTKKASEEFEGEIKLGVGNEGQRSGSVLISGPLAEKVYGSIAYSKKERDGWFKNTLLNKEQGDWEQEGARGQLRFEPSSQLEVILAGDYGSTTSEMPIFTPIALGAYTSEKADELDDVEFWGSALTVNYSTDSDYMLTSISSYRESEYVLDGDEDFTAAIEAFQTVFDEDGDQFSQEFRLVSPQNETYDWVAGLYYFDGTTATGRNLTFGAPLVPAAQLGGTIAIPSSLDMTSYAVYLHGNYRITPQLEITAGIRFTDEEKEIDFSQANAPVDPVTGSLILQSVLGLDSATADFMASQLPGSLFGAFDLVYQDSYSDSNWSPTLGINYQLNDDIMYYAKYSRGYQSGGFNGDFNPYLPAIQFDPEYVDAFEIGMKSTLADGTLRFNGDIFVQKYSDFQLFQRVPVGNSSVQIVSNAGEVTSQGVEVEAVWLPTDGLQLTFNATYLDATYDKFDNPIAAVDATQPANFNGNNLNNAPDLKYFVGLQYIHSIGNVGDLTYNLDYSYTDEYYTGASNADVELVADYDLWNARVTFNPVSDKWQLSAWVQNIADDEYVTNHSETSLTLVERVIWGAPRLFGISASYYLGR